MGGRLGMDLTRSTRWPVQFTQPKLSKEERAIEILPLCEGGKVFLPAHGRFRDLEKELADFPAGTTDLADCFVYCLQYCKLARARLRDDELWNEQIKRLEGGWMLR
jgi:phage terminase large subunit-like protein